MREFLARFPKPSHYAGVEDGIIIKNDAHLRVALAFPDTYEIGMSYLGQKILYGIINSTPGWQAERVMAPDRETGRIMRENYVSLATLETDTPLKAMDAVGFSITHELCYTNVLYMLDLAGIPLRHKDRPEDLTLCPLVMAGGGAMISAEPLAPFLDLALLGDGEEMLPEVLLLLERAKRENWRRSAFLAKAAKINGVYVPSLFECQDELRPVIPGYRPARRIVADLDKAPYPATQVEPVGAVHNRLSLEIARGCGRGCRFCQAGMVYRPVRERSLDNLHSILNNSLDGTGYEEVSFLALSAGDYSGLRTLWERAFDRCEKEHVTLALPSLRVGSVNDEIVEKMASLRRVGCTLAPEAGSQRLRDVINKGITEEQLIEHIRKLLQYGWRQVKLYFMIGLPTETRDDLEAIADLCLKARDAGIPGASRMNITASISPFVPKPFTPFQWEAQASREDMRERINFCRDLFRRHKFLTLRWHDPDSSHLEGILSRADRRMADVVELAYKKGAIFCNWAESFNLQPWLEALEEAGIKATDMTGPRDLAAALPWEHIEAGVSREFLLRERARAYAGKITSDCREGACRQCGACDTKAGLSLLHSHGDINEYRLRLVFPCSDQARPRKDNPAVTPFRRTVSKIDLAQFNRRCHYRFWHDKKGNFAYLSQLELQSVLYRAMRRCKLPIAFSQGFHPLPLLSFGRALPVGMQSHAEWFGITLQEYVEPQKLLRDLNVFLAEGLRVHEVEAVDKSRKTEQSVFEIFTLSFVNENEFSAVARNFNEFMKNSRFEVPLRSKKGERIRNIRPLVAECSISDSGNIMFRADWREEYVSPLVLASALAGQQIRDGLKLTKMEQIFADGRRYGMVETARETHRQQPEFFGE